MTITNGIQVSNENNANLVWAIANLLRGPYRPAQYGEVILPFTVLRRLDCVLEATKPAVLAEYEAKKDNWRTAILNLKGVLDRYDIPFPAIPEVGISGEEISDVDMQDIIPVF